ncbi:MAG: putative transporter transrane protein [Acidimicrobiaceae bacterium]|nr:putative transporter transrane protein [Acidimicrobiaceae bacterium]
MSVITVPPATPRERSLPPGRYGISGLLRSEWTKLRTVRSTLWSFATVIVLGIGLGALATAETRAHWASMGLGDRLSFDATRTSLIGVFFAQLVIGVLGVLVVTSEYGTGTIRATFSAAPRRPLVLAAKTAVFAAVSLVISEVVAFISYFLGQALLSAPATNTSLGSPGALRAVVGSGLYLCVLGLIALGLGVLIRHTAGAIGAFVGVLLVLPLIISALPSSIANDLQRFLPANIGSSIVSLHPGSHNFAPWTGFAVLAVYAVVLLVVGGILLVRRDA